MTMEAEVPKRSFSPEPEPKTEPRLRRKRFLRGCPKRSKANLSHGTAFVSRCKSEQKAQSQSHAKPEASVLGVRDTPVHPARLSSKPPACSTEAVVKGGNNAPLS